MWFLILGEDVAEAIEAALPECASLGDPLLGGAQGSGSDGEGADTADFFGMDEAAGLQDLEVLDDRGERHGQGLGELADGRRAAGKAIDQGTPSGVGEGLEEAIERLGGIG
jgi:hypothetical protein